MRVMRVLLVSHPPLASEMGAAQTALNLAAALRARGHDALAWSPEPLPPATRWWNLWRSQAAAIERFAAAEGPFDVIDTPAVSASAELARRSRLVVRSIQPELRYLSFEVAESLRRLPSPRALAHAAYDGRKAAAILGGWRRARAILCLGSLELAWMRRRFPRWADKLGVYVLAPPPADRAALAGVRARRAHAADRPSGAGARFLWMGRWVAHKGVRRLLDFMAARLASHPGDRFTLAGCGADAERDCDPDWLRSGRVRIQPSFTRAEVPALLAGHDAGLFTSRVEGWGLSLVEMLESGMPVYATPAGAVADLQPFFPASLRPFPPPPAVEQGNLEDLEANGYLARFHWAAIAEEYERQALRSLA